MEKPAQNTDAQNGQVQEATKASSDGSVCGYGSLHHLLSENLKPHIFQVTFLNFLSVVLLSFGAFGYRFVISLIGSLLGLRPFFMRQFALESTV